jgi:inactivated superfamily I helicase
MLFVILLEFELLHKSNNNREPKGPCSIHYKSQAYEWALPVSNAITSLCLEACNHASHSHTFNLSCLLHASEISTLMSDLESKICSSTGCLGLQRLFCNWQESKHSKNAWAVEVVNLQWPGASETAVLVVRDVPCKMEFISMTSQECTELEEWGCGKHFCKWEQTISKLSLCRISLPSMSLSPEIYI